MLIHIAVISVILLESHGDSNSHSRHKVNSLLRIATHNNPLAGYANVTNGNMGLMEKDLLQWLSQTLNFSYVLVAPKDVRQLGTLQPNGSWSGTLGLLVKGEADATISFGIRNWNRHSSFDITSAIITDSIGIMVPFPTVIGINPSALADVYTDLTWFLILFSTAATIGYLWVLGKMKPNDRIEFGSLVIYITGVLLGQGGWIRAFSGAFQFVFGIWLLGLLVISYGYTGSLISRMSAPSVNYLARSLEDIAANNKLTPYTIGDSATHAEFKESTLSAFKGVNEKFLSNPVDFLLASYDGIVDMIHNKQTAVFIFSDIVIENEIKRDYKNTGQCRALLLNQKVLVRRNGLFLQKNSRWTHSFDDQMLLLRQHGFGMYLENKYKTFTTGKCSINEQEVRKREYNGPIGFYHIKAAFYVLAAGLFTSLIAFVFEHIFFRWSRRSSGKGSVPVKQNRSSFKDSKVKL